MPTAEPAATRLTAVEQDLLDGAKTWFTVKEQYDVYSDMRQSAYDHPKQAGASTEDIWDGDGVNTNALLTVFRHHDNASVRRGLIGDYPLTVWWMDYPLFERGYYNLVVNFDVFGSVSHQAQTRLYFDLIRNDAERNFLRLLPTDARQKLMDRWYEGTAQLKLITAYPGILASYPNFIFNVAVNEIDDFIDTVLATDAERDFEKAVVARWGVRRTHPRFWELFHDLTTYLDEHTPIDAGVMDMSRYQNL